MATPAREASGAWTTGSRPGRADLRPLDVGLGALMAVLALGGMGVALAASSSSTPAETTPLLRPGEIAVPVQPVVAARPDADRASTPPRDPASAPHVDTTRLVPPSSVGLVSPEARPDGSSAVAPRPPDAPPPTTGPRPPRPEGGIRGLPRLSPPTTGALPVPDAAGPVAPGFGRGGPTVLPGEADPAQSPDDPYAYVDPAREDPSAPPGTGVVGEDVELAPAEPAGDPLAERAVVAYRQRLQRWLSTRYSVVDSGLPTQTLSSARIRAKLEVEDGVVVGYHLEPGGPDPLQDAARRALTSVVGAKVPALPEHYPGPLQRWVSVTFVCTEDTCD